jgi:copper homeostasis protein
MELEQKQFDARAKGRGTLSMPGQYFLEISVGTVEAAVAAEQGGAHRIELCGDLSVGGITPSAELMRAVRAQVRLPIFSMVRPRGGDFVHSATEFESMKRDIGVAKELRMDGIVLGILTSARHVDVERARQLVELARPLPVTFHRAFDECADLKKSLEEVIQTGATRILTSGGAASAAEGLSTLAKLVELARDRIIILPGAGINISNILDVARQTHAREFHSGLSSSLPHPRIDHQQFEAEIRELVKLLAGPQRALNG